MATNITGYGATKVRNAFNREKRELDLEFHLRNTKINGSLVGCVGFIVNTATGKIVYLDTEESVYGPLQGKTLYRTAEHLKDYTGGRNRFTEDVQNILDLLADTRDNY